jgi:serine/threonine protein kinase
MSKDEASRKTFAQAYALAGKRPTVQFEHVTPQSQTTSYEPPPPGRNFPEELYSFEPPQIIRNIPKKAFSRLQGFNASTSSKPDNCRPSHATPSTVEDLTSIFKDLSVFKDWSGRGSHVDYLPEEVLPLKEGRFLGHGIMGGVYETTIGDYTFAWKRRFCRRKITDVEKKEIEILKKLAHEHIIQLVGTYTHRQFLGLLLYPVAVCDLATFIDDYECICKEEELESVQKERLNQLRLPSGSRHEFQLFGGKYLYSKIGCLISAVEYLHKEKIRHKDLKPSNILLSARGLWLTDFGTATDFSLLSTSSTENCERGTPKYFAPEIAEYAKSGRAADIFSLGCILLELLHLLANKSLRSLKSLRPELDMSYQANLHHIDEWFLGFEKDSARTQHLLLEIRQMLEKDPQNRCSATVLCERIGLIDRFSKDSTASLFGNCCRDPLMRVHEYDKKVEYVKNDFQQEIQALQARIAGLEADKMKLTAIANRRIIAYKPRRKLYKPPGEEQQDCINGAFEATPTSGSSNDRSKVDPDTKSKSEEAVNMKFNSSEWQYKFEGAPVYFAYRKEKKPSADCH